MGRLFEGQTTTVTYYVPYSVRLFERLQRTPGFDTPPRTCLEPFGRSCQDALGNIADQARLPAVLAAVSMYWEQDGGRVRILVPVPILVLVVVAVLVFVVAVGLVVVVAVVVVEVDAVVAVAVPVAVAVAAAEQ